MKNAYKSLSNDEVYFISRAEYEKQKVITTSFAQKVFNDKNKSSRILVYLQRKGRLLRIEKGKYLLVPLKAPNQQWMPNEFVLASLWMENTPYYIGYNTAYNYWGFTEQIPQTVFVLNTEKSIKRKIGTVQYTAVKVASNKIYGLKKITIEAEKVCISDKERTLVDYVYKPMGSWEQVENVLADQLPEIHIEKLVQYSIRFPVESVGKRIGLMLERLGIPEKKLEPLRNSIGTGNSYSTYNPFIASRKGNVNQKWKVILNG